MAGSDGSMVRTAMSTATEPMQLVSSASDVRKHSSTASQCEPEVAALQTQLVEESASVAELKQDLQEAQNQSLSSLNQVAAVSEEVDLLENDLVTASHVVNAQIDEIIRLRGINASLQSALGDQRWLTYVTLNEEFLVPNWFTGGSSAPGADGQLAVRTVGNEAVFLVSGLPENRDGFEYRLWLQGLGEWKHATSFQVDESGSARVEFGLDMPISLYTSAVVTREQITGAPIPNGVQVLTSTN